MNRIHNPAHSLKLFQRDIFWPVIESIRDGRAEMTALDREESELLQKIIGDESVVGLEGMLVRQRELAAQRAEKQAELDRKWTLVHAGCQWMAMQLSESDSLGDPALKPSLEITPELVRRVLVDGAKVYADNLEAN